MNKIVSFRIGGTGFCYCCTICPYITYHTADLNQYCEKHCDPQYTCWIKVYDGKSCEYIIDIEFAKFIYRTWPYFVEKKCTLYNAIYNAIIKQKL